MDESELCQRLQHTADLTPREWAEAVKNWGYRLLDRPHPHSPGFRILLVALRDAPTHEHYDPEIVELCVLAGQDVIESTRLTRAAQPMRAQRVCPGGILLEDRVHKEVNFFTYGAQLDVIPLEAETVCAFRSSAPILPMEEGGDVFASQLASESGALLAEIRASWGADRAGYAQRLAETPSDALYVATLRSIVALYHRSPALRENFRAFYVALLEEFLWQQEQGGVPEQGPLLEEVLGPVS